MYAIHYQAALRHTWERVFQHGAILAYDLLISLLIQMHVRGIQQLNSAFSSTLCGFLDLATSLTVTWTIGT